eukprot:scpid63837/ scgid1643/ Alcohol dehydrogenase [NADP(+)]; 3-DG-reducing enzyme; Aldehyde reductase; Aldo-keto reductase family 1 member A1
MPERRVVSLHDGSQMPTVGLGTWKAEPSKVCNAVSVAIREGYRHIDCAAVYGNEGEVGQALIESMQSGVVKREEMFIVSKLWNADHQHAKVKPALERSLKLLNLDYIDLYLMHWPLAMHDDRSLNFDIHFMETWKAMEELVDCGLARHIGLSNFNQAQISEVLSSGRIHPAVLQIENHPYLTQTELVEFCLSNNIQVTAYCPLARAGFPRPDRPGNLLEHPTVCSIAAAHNATPTQVLVRFQLERGITVIPKSVTAERIKENIQVFAFSFSDEEMKSLHAINLDWRIVPNEGCREHPLFPFSL